MKQDGDVRHCAPDKPGDSRLVSLTNLELSLAFLPSPPFLLLRQRRGRRRKE